MDSGLNQTEAENQLAQETGDNFRLLSQLQQLQDDLENVLAKNTEPPCKKLNQAMREDKGVEMMLDRTLNSIFNPIEIMFNNEARQFIPALMDPNAYSVPISDLPTGSNGSLDLDQIEKLSKAGQNSAMKSSTTTKQANSFGEALKTVTRYKIETPDSTPDKPKYFENITGGPDKGEFKSVTAAEEYTNRVVIGTNVSDDTPRMLEVKNSNNALYSEYKKYRDRS